MEWNATTSATKNRWPETKLTGARKTQVLTYSEEDSNVDKYDTRKMSKP